MPARCEDLIAHLSATTALDDAGARRVVEEIVAYFAEPTEALVRRRHGELKAEGLPNAVIYPQIAAELAQRPVAAPRLSERQIRRLISG